MEVLAGAELWVARVGCVCGGVNAADWGNRALAWRATAIRVKLRSPVELSRLNTFHK